MVAATATVLASQAQPVHSIQHAHLIITAARLGIIPAVAVVCSHSRSINDNDVSRVDADGSIIVVADVTDHRAELEVIEEIQGHGEAVGHSNAVGLWADGLHQRRSPTAPHILDSSIIIVAVHSRIVGSIGLQCSLDGILAGAAGLDTSEEGKDEEDKKFHYIGFTRPWVS